MDLKAVLPGPGRRGALRDLGSFAGLCLFTQKTLRCLKGCIREVGGSPDGGSVLRKEGEKVKMVNRFSAVGVRHVESWGTSPGLSHRELTLRRAVCRMRGRSLPGVG